MESKQVENLYAVDCIRTFTGIYINVFEPTEDMIDIVDIAHALSNQCRFGGHLYQFFSVAQHCCNCCYLVNGIYNRKAALLHDAAEAYLVDVPRPIKKRLANYNDIENGLMIVIAKKFGFEYPLSKEVKAIDEAMLNVEWESLMLRKNNAIEYWEPQRAKANFLNAFKVNK